MRKKGQRQRWRMGVEERGREGKEMNEGGEEVEIEEEGEKEGGEALEKQVMVQEVASV